MSSPPIGKAKEQPKEVNDTGNSDPAPYDPDGGESTPFDQGQLIQAWSNFADSIKDSNPRHYSLLQSYPPTLEPNYQVVVFFEGQIQVDLFLEIKNELAAYLRKQLQNPAITITEAIQEQQTQNRPYTPDEKFRFMAEKNPALIKLKQQMNLDFS